MNLLQEKLHCLANNLVHPRKYNYSQDSLYTFL